ncbi:MAG: hypothetical protein ACRDO7_08565 [Nocardioidaceae bacterium]
MRAVLVGALAGALLVPAVPAAADDGERVVTITDDRIAESSGLAVSPDNPRLLYTLNDSDNAPSVYAIDRRSGDVVGVTTLTGHTLADTEAIAVGTDGTMWVADIGDNSASRDDVALYTLPEPGRGDATVTPDRYPLTYPSGPQDAETILVGPDSRPVMVVAKGLVGGRVYRLPGEPRTDRPNRLRPVRGAEVPGLVTDGSFTPDGSRVVLRTYDNAVAYDAETWKETWATSLPRQQQGESLSVEADGRSLLIGSEGTPSPVLRVGLPAAPEAKTSGGDDSGTADEAVATDESRLDLGIKVLGGLGALLTVLVVWIVIAARRSHRRHQEGGG